MAPGQRVTTNPIELKGGVPMQPYIDQTGRGLGAAPGIEHDELAGLSGDGGHVSIVCIDYCPDKIATTPVSDLEGFVGQHRPEWAMVRWICVEGLNPHVVRVLATKYNLHPLAIEDMLQKSQRPKVESYGGDSSEWQARLFIVAQALENRAGRLHHEQISIFVGHQTVLTFQAHHSNQWDAIRQRMQAKGSRLRSSDASFLAYSLLDAIIDHCFPLLEACSDQAEELEDLILGTPPPDLIGKIHQFKRDLLLIRWMIWPMREVVVSLQRDPHECISETTRVYLRDLYDHVVQIIDLIETYREIAADLIETYMSSVSNRMNEIMKVLTLIGTIFLPLTFLAGVYGMNFHYLPELDMVWAYPAFWLICLITAGSMLAIFRRRHWL